MAIVKDIFDEASLLHKCCDVAQQIYNVRMWRDKWDCHLCVDLNRSFCIKYMVHLVYRISCSCTQHSNWLMLQWHWRCHLMKVVLSSFTNSTSASGVAKKLNCKEGLLQNKISERLPDKPIRYPFVNLMHTTSLNQEIHNTMMEISCKHFIIEAVCELLCKVRLFIFQQMNASLCTICPWWNNLC